jgi:hypothetical protein
LEDDDINKNREKGRLVRNKDNEGVLSKSSSFDQRTVNEIERKGSGGCFSECGGGIAFEKHDAYTQEF